MIISMLQMGMGEQGTIGNLSCEAGTLTTRITGLLWFKILQQ